MVARWSCLGGWVMDAGAGLPLSGLTGGGVEGRGHRRGRGEGRSFNMTKWGARSDGPTTEEKVVLCA